MRLEKLHSGSNYSRSVSIHEILSQYIFNGTYPTKFKPGNFYSIGDYVYVINDDGTISVYQCLNSGIYNAIDMIDWIVANISTTVNNSVNNILGVNPVESDTSVLFDYKVYTNSDLTINDKSITLPENVNIYSKLLVFLDGKYISSDLGEYTVTINNHKRSIDVRTTFTDILVHVINPKNHNAHMISFSDIRPSSMVENSGNVIVYVPADITDTGYGITVYNKGVFVSPSSYSYEYDTTLDDIVIEFPLGIITNKNDVTVTVVTSRSNDITVEPFLIAGLVTNGIETYRINVLNADMYYKSLPIVFKSGKCIPYDVINVDDDVLSITDSSYYGIIGDSIDIMSYKFSHNVNDTSSLGAAIMVNPNERHIPIPIIGYTNDVDFLAFYKSGAYISRNRYYKRDGYIHVFDHVDSITAGDLILFEGINKDASVAVRSIMREVDFDGSIVLNDSVSQSQFLVFTSSGLYIGKHQYNVSNNILTFISGLDIRPGDTIEVVYVYYKNTYTNTVCKIGSVNVNTSRELIVPMVNYNQEKDKLILFNSNSGIYIEPSKYSVKANGIITIADDDTVLVNDNIDILIIRTFERSIFRTSVNYVLDIL